VARRVQEGHAIPFGQLHLVGADVLGDAAVLTAGDIRLAQGQEMGRFLLGSTVVMLFPLPSEGGARLAFNPPWWEVALSLTILIGTAMFFVWISGRIYRVGILLYGKKAGMKELVKWVFMK
jgi:hypothetical protein